MKCFKKIIFLLLFGTIIIASPIVVKAVEDHSIKYKVYNCLDLATPSRTTAQSCISKFHSGALDSYAITENSTVEKGSTMMVVLSIKYNHTQFDGGGATIMNLKTPYDNTVLEPLKYARGTQQMGMTTIDKSDANPLWQSGDYIANDWQATTNDTGSKIIVFLEEATADFPLDYPDYADIIFMFFKVKETAEANKAFNFNLEPWPETSMSTTVGGAKNITFDSIGFNLQVAGAAFNSDNTLKNFVVTGGGNDYSSQLNFTAGSSTKEYSIVVPNGVSTINLNLTTNFDGAQIITDSPSTRTVSKDYNVNVGDNEITFIVQAENGVQAVYTLNIKRLSSDADLSALSMDQEINLGTFAPDTYSYNVNVPYKISNVNFTATANHVGAQITSTLDNFELTNTGSAVNSKNIVVNAEDCKTEYESVAGNVCTSKTYTINITRTAASTNAFLQNLMVDGVPIADFDKNQLEYTITNVQNSVSSINVTGVVEDTDKATIKSGAGIANLTVGDNVIRVLVEAEDETTTKEYVINVRRLSNNTKLLSLDVTSTPRGNLTPSFLASYTGAYTYTYQEGITDITVSATVHDTGNATIAINEEGSTLNAAEQNTSRKVFGLNVAKVIVTVTAEDATIQTYEINLTRATSTDTYLKSLEVVGYTISPTFKEGTKTYSVTVPANIESVNINALPKSDYARIKSITGNDVLDFGLNNIEIVVEAENLTTGSYMLNVTREKYNIATLDSISVDNNPVTGFSATNLNYTYDEVPYETTTINLDAVKTNSYSTVEGLGEKTLKTGNNSFDIIVTSHDEKVTKTYTIVIPRAKNADNSIAELKVKNRTAQAVSDGVYSITLPNEITRITPDDVSFTVADGATIDKTQNLDLVTTSVNEYSFSVTSEKGVVKPYVINITREKSSNNELTKVTLSIANSEDKYCNVSNGKCTINVPVTTTEFTINSTIDATASVDPTNGSVIQMPSNESTKVLTITVTAENDAQKTYSITVERAKSSNNNLAEITLNGAVIDDFDPLTQLYNITVDGTSAQANITATVEDTGKSTIKTDLSQPFDLDFKANTIQINVEAENKDVKTYTLIITRNKKTEARLSSITIDGVKIPTFSTDKYTYNIDAYPFEKRSINIGATTLDDDATTSNTGVKNLTTGDQQIIIQGIAHDGTTTKDYTLNITRNKNSDNSVKSITVKGLVPTLNSDGKYEVTLPNNITELSPDDVVITSGESAIINKDPLLTLSTKNVNEYNFTITSESGVLQPYNILITRTRSNDASLSKVVLTLNDSSDKYCDMTGTECSIDVPVSTTGFTFNGVINKEARINPINGTMYTMDSSTKDINVTVTAENGTEKEYIVHVIRNKSSNNNLASIRINGVSIMDFKASQQLYNLNYPGTTDSIEVAATLEDSKSRIKTDLSKPFVLQFGSNRIDIEVIAENQTTKTYTLMIVKSKRTEARLSSISIDSNPIATFDQDTFEYTVSEVSYDVHQINVDATTIDNLATVENNGVHNLNTGENTIVITGVAHDNVTKKQYTIKISRAKNSSTEITGIEVAGVEAIKNPDTGKYEVTVPNNVKMLNTLNVTVTPEPGLVASDALATYSVPELELSTKNENTLVIPVEAEDGTIQNYEVIVTRTKSDIATLKSLTVTNGGFLPSFTSNVYEYEVTVPVETTKVDITGVTTEENATITNGVGNNIALTSSSMDVDVTVVSEDEQVTKHYVLHIKRVKSSVNTLSEITVSSGSLSPTFEPNIVNYEVNVAGDVTSIDVGATLTDAKATIKSGVGTHDLVTGRNNIEIIVAGETGNLKTYTLTVIKAPSSDATLSSLKVNNEEKLDLGNALHMYNLPDVANDITTLQIDATPNHNLATVEGVGTIDLKTGKNILTVKVTAEDKITTKDYTIVITRTKSNVALLESLEVQGYNITPEFDSNLFSYTITVDETKDTLSPEEINAVPVVDVATIEKDNQIKLSTTTENTFNITVTAENGIDANDYQIKIIRPRSTDTTLKEVRLINGTLVGSITPNIREYTIKVPYTNTMFTIEGVPNVDRATVSGNNSYKSDVGTITLRVTSESGTTGDYTFNIEKTFDGNATLANIVPSVGTIDFESSKTSYVLSVPYENDEIDFTITSTDPKSSLRINNQTYISPKVYKMSNLNVGSNNILSITVTSQDGMNNQTYTIVVTREPQVLSNENKLNNITIENYPLDKTFNPEELTYSIGDIPVEVDELIINTEKLDEKSTVKYYVNDTINPTNTLTIPNTLGNGTIKIVVTAEDGTEKEYVINYNKFANNNNYLSNLQVSTGSINFVKTTNEYSVVVDSTVSSIDVTATKEHETSVLAINGNNYESPHTLKIENLVDGENLVTITVTSQSGVINTYTLTITKTSINDEKITSLTYGHTIDETYIRTVSLNTTGLEMKNQLDNDNAKLEIWSSDGNTKMDDTAKMATGMIIKLVVDGQIKDQKTIVVVGDVNGDGKITLPDAVLVVNQFLAVLELDTIQQIAADTSKDNKLGLPDAVRIVNHFLGTVPLY